MPNFDAAVSQKSFFKGDKVHLKWNNDGTSLIVLAQTEVDKSGKNYYGETTLYLMSANGGFDSRIDLGELPRQLPRKIISHVIRQGWSYTRCHMVAEFERVRCSVWVHASKDNDFQHTSHSYA